jgi:hypothetical protein
MSHPTREVVTLVSVNRYTRLNMYLFLWLSFILQDADTAEVIALAKVLKPLNSCRRHGS